METSNTINEMTKKIAELNDKIKVLANDALHQETQILALITLLEKNKILTFDEYDKHYEKIEKQISKQRIQLVEQFLEKRSDQ